MKKTLLLTTALIGTLSVLGTAQAETKISGELKYAYKSMDGLTTGSPAISGFTSERQINFSNTGKLNNGLAYATGFSLELEGDNGATGYTDGGEGNYFNIISGNTTVTLGMDHILNGDYAIVPRAGTPINESIGRITGVAEVRTGTRTGLQYSQGLGDNNESMGLGIVQKIPSVGTLAVNYVPKDDDNAKTGDTLTPTSPVAKDAYSIFFVGDLGVPGLQVAIDRAQNTANGGTEVSDQKVAGYGARYTMGSISVGAEMQKYTDHTNAETETKEIGLTYKLNDNASIGIGRIVTEGKNTSGVKLANDEEVDYLQIGYNLGGFGTSFDIINADNVAFNSAQSTTAYVFKIVSKF